MSTRLSYFVTHAHYYCKGWSLYKYLDYVAIPLLPFQCSTHKGQIMFPLGHVLEVKSKYWRWDLLEHMKVTKFYCDYARNDLETVDGSFEKVLWVILEWYWRKT